jgi:multiple sugar transport system ATP-binding protein
MRKYAKDEITTRVLQAAEILGIKEMLDRKPKALSGGQRQRVALGRAIVRKPKVFLFDEPLSNLDANLRVQMRTEISRLHKQIETTMIYVTHDQTEAMSMGDRIVVMKGGFIQQIDSPLNIYNKPANQFVAGFIGSPTMNFIHGSVLPGEQSVFTNTEHSLSLTLPISHAKFQSVKDLVLGIRPEHISAKPQGTNNQKVRVTIQVTEPMGNEIFVYFTIGRSTNQYIARIPSDIQPPVGKEYDLYFDALKFHFFDHSTGIAI